MALDIKLKYSINAAVTQILIQDDTGAYDINNLGGWGAPNIERNSVALVLYATYNGFEQTPQNLSLTNALSPVILYDPTYLNTEVSSYTLSYLKDGWYKFYLVAIPTENLTPFENDIIYNIVEDRLDIYKAGIFVALESADWEFLANDAKYTLEFKEEIFLSNLVIQRNCQLEKYITCMECTSCKCEVIKEDYTRLNALIQATDYRFHSDKQSEAQKMVEKLTKDYKCCK